MFNAATTDGRTAPDDPVRSARLIRGIGLDHARQIAFDITGDFRPFPVRIGYLNLVALHRRRWSCWRHPQRLREPETRRGSPSLSTVQEPHSGAQTRCTSRCHWDIGPETLSSPFWFPADPHRSSAASSPDIVAPNVWLLPRL